MSVNEKPGFDVDNYNDGGLQRGLKNRHMQLIALGGIIGSCYFLGTGYIVGDVGPSAFLAYILGGIIIYLVMICMGELSVHIPISGSFVTYAADFISPAWACGVGWTYWINWVAYIPAECTAAGIIMHYFFPSTSEYMWAILFGLLITFINLAHVKSFGEVEFWLAIVKILALLFFIGAAILIFFGIIHGDQPAEVVGTKYIFGNGGLFPNGTWVLVTTMVMLLVNFQGSEIIGLAAGEAQDPSKTIPIAVRNVVFRIVFLYLAPVFMLVLIYPWEKAGLSESVFASALEMYGLKWAAGVFTFAALTAALSCANSGMYGTVRSLYGLAREGMAPRVFAKLNKNAVPGNATFATLAGVWIFLALSYFFSASDAFAALLSISGFTGTMCWISLCWSQYNFRKRLLQAGYTTADLKYVTPGFPVLTQLGIWLQVGCLVFTLFNPDLRVAFYFGVPALLIPMILYKVLKVDHTKALEEQSRVRFEDIFPPKNTGVNA